MNETKFEIKSNEESKKQNTIQEQFRSTKRWNDLIEAFCTNMPLKRHWRNFRTYSDCFTASEAIECLYEYLKTNQNFSHLSVSRHNAIKVLQILLKDKIIEDVRSGDNINKEFQDDDRVYKFNSKNQYYLNRTTASSSVVSSLTTNISMQLSTSNPKKTGQNDLIVENKENIDEKDDCFEAQLQEKKIHNSNNKQSNERINILRKNSKKNELVVCSNTLSSKKCITDSIPSFTSTLDHQEKDFKNDDTISFNLNVTGSIMKSSSSSSSYISNANNNQKINEVWSKTMRKMIESVIKKGVLNNNIIKKCHGKITENSNIISLLKENTVNKLENLKYDRISPPSTSTLKRSTDIKLNLSKLLDKKTYDILTNISGSNIKHNCTHINKHGVVINTESDLPSWLVKAMTTLLLWDNDARTDDLFPKFKDVFDEVNSYFNDLKEPLLTKDLSHLFLQILELLTIPTSSNFSLSKESQKNNTEEKLCIKVKRQILEEYDEIVRLFVTSVVFMNKYDNILATTVEKLIELLKDKMIKNHLELEEMNIENKCMSYQLLDAILCISSDNTTSNFNLLEKVESNLINNAKLPFINDTIMSNFQHHDDCQLKNDESNQENEYLLQNLLLASLERLENCCDECLIIYNEINNLLNIKTNDHDENLKNTCNLDALTERFETTAFIDTTLKTNLQRENLKKACLNEILMGNENEEDNLKIILNLNRKYNQGSNNTFLNIIDDQKFDQKKLHRNNSFRAAIGEKKTEEKTKEIKKMIEEFRSTDLTTNSYENEDFLFKMPKPKRLTRIVTNSINSNYKCCDETISSSTSSNKMLNSSISSAVLQSVKTNSEENNSEFKLPFNPPSQTVMNNLNRISKSNSMNLNQTSIVESNIKSKKKRKCAENNSNDEAISHSNYFNNRFHENNNTLSFNTFKSASQLKIPELFSDMRNSQITPSYSLTTLNKVSKLDGNFFSLKNLSQVDANNDENTNNENAINQLNVLSSMSLSELSLFIRSNMNSSYLFSNIPDSTSIKSSQSDDSNEMKNFKITLASEIDSDVFYFIISAFRLCALTLPPTNKRKLHLLLRFLNKLKHNKHTAKYLLNKNYESISFLEDINFIDISATTNQSLNMSNHGNKTFKVNLNHDLENKSNAIESVIIKSFANSIVYFNKNEGKLGKNEVDLKEQLVVKLVQILINNYTEIMRIPEDLISNIKSKINTIKMNSDPITSSTVNSSDTTISHAKLSTRYCSKISLQQYDKQKAELSKKHLTNLLNSILTDVNLKENEKLIKLRKFKETYPHIYEEKYPTIKKALSILGINETIDNNVPSSIISTSNEDLDVMNKKKNFSNIAHNLNQTTNLFSHTKSFHRLFNKAKKNV